MRLVSAWRASILGWAEKQRQKQNLCLQSNRILIISVGDNNLHMYIYKKKIVCGSVQKVYVKMHRPYVHILDV